MLRLEWPLSIYWTRTFAGVRVSEARLRDGSSMGWLRPRILVEIRLLLFVLLLSCRVGLRCIWGS